ncbi:unnamed protein product [Rotaria magnacalcarata]|uniref:Integrase catalytic domain-containing protein n=1 Tax=Rotaria magnacalcarata TaxID=392030 RepID=A0A816BQG0_9BILA|nr:unnamed protein product [Rotaria magnacalcarata]CAF1614528.1 unnamed protein product [Rotaria magnacalcarata]
MHSSCEHVSSSIVHQSNEILLLLQSSLVKQKTLLKQNQLFNDEIAKQKHTTDFYSESSQNNTIIFQLKPITTPLKYSFQSNIRTLVSTGIILITVLFVSILFGKINWYRKFIPDFASIAAPLHKVTNKTKYRRHEFKWGIDQQHSFDEFKRILTTYPLFLEYPDLSTTFILTMDASDIGIGGILRQDTTNGRKLIIFNHLIVNIFFSIPYHPQINRQTERWNSTFVTQIAKYCNTDQNNWDIFLPSIVYAYNHGTHSSTGFNPYQLAFGRQPRYPFDPSTSTFIFSRPHDYWTHAIKYRNTALKQAQASILHQQQLSKTRFDKNRSYPSFVVGDLAWMKILVERHKLKARYTGPARIIRILSSISFIVEDDNLQQFQVHSNNIRRDTVFFSAIHLLASNTLTIYLFTVALHHFSLQYIRYGCRTIFSHISCGGKVNVQFETKYDNNHNEPKQLLAEHKSFTPRT